MTDLVLTQSEADALLALEKRKAGDVLWSFPTMGGSISIPLVSMDAREDFILDVSQGRINLKKRTFQGRGRQTIILARLDLGGPGHRNPDGEELPCPHLHLYREGFGDKWAVPPLKTEFTDLTDPMRTLQDFMRFFRIVDPPTIQRGLWE